MRRPRPVHSPGLPRRALGPGGRPLPPAPFGVAPCTAARPWIWVLGLVVLAAAPIRAQETPPDSAPPSERVESRRGWIGIAFRDPSDDGGPGTFGTDGVRISGVLRGSPADRSGIRPGEILLSIDGESVGPEALAERARRIRVGDSLTLALRGPSGRREVLLVAGPPPQNPPVPPRARVMARVDSIQEAMRRRLDSLRARMRGNPDDSAPWSLRELRLLGGDAPPERGGLRPGDPDRRALPRRPPRLYSLGADYVAGARMVDLNPALAEYFAVERGVLAVEVLDGSPAADAGLLPGDVIVAVGNREIGSVEELRVAMLDRRDEELQLRVIRKGETVRIPLGGRGPGG